jgi:hypothetical protein
MCQNVLAISFLENVSARTEMVNVEKIESEEVTSGAVGVI